MESIVANGGDVVGGSTMRDGGRNGQSTRGLSVAIPKASRIIIILWTS